MKKILMILLISSVFSFGFDVARDKQKHIFVSALIGGLITHYTDSFWAGVGVSMLVGVGKEYYDSGSPIHTEDINDVYADMGGAMLGSAIMVGIHLSF